MTDIVVHRCELRIRRTSGWAWGAAPDDLIKAATRAIPQLLAARLPDLAVPAGTTVDLQRPVTVKLTATARQLVALADPSSSAPGVPELRARIEADVAAAVAEAIAREGVASTAPTVTLAAAQEAEAAAAVREDDLASADAPRRAVRTWWRAGEIREVLERLEPEALARLHELLLGDAGTTEGPPAEVLTVVERAASAYGELPESAVERVRRRIALAAAAIDAVPAVAQGRLRVAIDRVVPLDDDIAAGVAETAHAGDAQVHVPRESTSTGELTVRSALPFLLLAGLRHAGWLDAAAGLLALHRREADAFALAAGLAAKVLDPLERGWKRSHADRIAIAAFAGRTESIDDAEIAAAVARLTPVLAPLGAGLRAVILRARAPVPIVLWREERGWYVLDGDGMVVLAAGSLPEVIAAAPAAPIVVPARFASREVFDRIDYASARFITDAPPWRGDAWRSFAGATGRLYTNDAETPAGKLAALTAHLEHTLALAEELVEVLAERPAIARGSLDAFESTCALAATCALADIGARLFPAEPTTPVLALTRFRDLDARVIFEPDRVRVRVPLGRRHADLLRHGILGEVAVPWLAGGTIDLGGG